jgi:hypothetical protein
MHPNKIRGLLRMRGAQRFDYFVRKVADGQELWGLYSDGWATASDAAARRAMPLWPERELAAQCKTGAWAAYEPKEIELEAFLEGWAPKMGKDGVLVAVFPTPDDKGVMVEAKALADALVKESSQYQ